MYKIMIVAKEASNYGSLYKWLLVENDQGQNVPYEASTLEEIDKKVEDMLNKEGYSKSDFIVISVTNYNISADIVE